MKSDKPRRTPAGKPAAGRNARAADAGKGRLRSTRRERKFFAQPELLQSSEAADRAPETAAKITADTAFETPAAAVFSEGSRVENASGTTAAQEAAPRDQAVEVAKGAPEPSGSTASNSGRDVPEGASEKGSVRPSRGRKSKADATKADVAAHAATKTEAEAVPAAALARRKRRRKEGDEAAQPRRGGKAASAGSARKNGPQAEGSRAATETVTEAAKKNASTTRQRRNAADTRAATARSAARSTASSDGLSPAGSASHASRPGQASRGGGAAPSGNAMSGTLGAPAAGLSPAEPLSFGRAPDAFALAQEAAEIGAAALHDVATARSLPELVEAQLHCGRAASEIWVHQLRIAASLFLLPSDPWWPSPDAVAASLPE